MRPVTDAHSPLALAQGLIRCPSVTPQEGGALAYLAPNAARENRASRGAFPAPRLSLNQGP
jgi:hypothetical protein